MNSIFLPNTLILISHTVVASMVDPFRSSLDNIVSTSDQFIHLIAPYAQKSSIPTKITKKAPPLHLPDVDSQSLHQALSKRNISASVHASLSQQYLKRSGDLKQIVLSHWQNLCSSVHAVFEESTLMTLSKILLRKYLESLKELESGILSVLDEKLKQFTCDAEAAAKSETESSSEDGLVNNRGHSRLAVAILERAYSHTTNISRAEKLRLAIATKLQPRQVTIWFQNRRNRKVAANNTSNDNKSAAEEALGRESAVSPSVSFHSRRSNKRKIDYDSSDEESEQSPQRVRRMTPDNSPGSNTDSLKGSSMSSSTDSLRSWSRGSLAKDRNYSTDSSVMEGGGEEKSMYRDLNGKGRTSAAISFDEQVERQIGSSSFSGQKGLEQRQEEEMSSALLFSDSGAVQLDFDDLGLDLNLLVEELPSFSNDAFDWSIPTPSTQLNDVEFEFDFQRTPRQSQFAIPNVPTSCEKAADLLNQSSIDAKEEFMRAMLIEKWAMGEGLVVEEEKEDSDEWFLDLEKLGWGGTSTPGSMSSSSPSTTAETSTGIATPTDIFDFSLGSLAINQIMDENFETFHVLQEDKAVRPKDVMMTASSKIISKVSEDFVAAR